MHTLVLSFPHHNQQWHNVNKRKIIHLFFPCGFILIFSLIIYTHLLDKCVFVLCVSFPFTLMLPVSVIVLSTTMTALVESISIEKGSDRETSALSHS